jgi:flagellar hook-length control protein FliK
MQAQIVPLQLAELGTALKDFAVQLEKVSPDLARSLAQLADRFSVGDIADDAMAQLGLSRTAASTSPEVEQLVAALTAKPATRQTAAAATAPIAAPVLDLPETIVAPAAPPADATPATRPEARQVVAPQSSPATPDAGPQAVADQLPETADLEIDTDIRLAPRPSQPKDEATVDDARPAAPASPVPKADTAPVAVTPVAAATETPAALAQAATTAATATRAIHAAYSAPVQQLNYPQVAFEVARQFEAGNTRFQIRLDPADLGRIDVKLDLDKSGTVSAHMFVERPETLDLMMRDQRALQQALQQAGLDSGKTSLEFSLRQNPFGTGADTGQGNAGGGQPGFGPFGTPAADESTELAAQSLYRGSASASGVNLFV